MPQLNHNYEYKDDIARIKLVAARCGEALSTENAVALWENYSDRFAAGWLVLPSKDTDLYAIISDFYKDKKGYTMQNFYQDTFTAPNNVVNQIKKAKEMYTNDEYMTVWHFLEVIDTINTEGHYELFEYQPHTHQLLFGDLINWLYVRDDDVDDQEDWYTNQPRQSYSEKASYREWCFIKYMFGEINVLPEG